MTNAPTIIARPACSKSPASINANPKAKTEKTLADLKNFRKSAIFREMSSPMAVTPNQMPKDLTVIHMMGPQAIFVPVNSTFAMATTIARQTMPRTSSMTAAAMIVTPSGELMARCSERIRAEMPTDVAVQRIPRKRQRGSMNSHPNANMPTAAPQTNEQTIPPMPTIVPTTEYLKNVRTSVSSPEMNSRMMEPMMAMP